MLLHYHLQVINKPKPTLATHAHIVSKSNDSANFENTAAMHIQMRVNSKDWKHGFTKESRLEEYTLNGNQ